MDFYKGRKSLREKAKEEDCIFLIPELLLLTGLDDDIRDNNDFKKEMITKTKLEPGGN
jgi:hypothetical protein